MRHRRAPVVVAPTMERGQQLSFLHTDDARLVITMTLLQMTAIGSVHLHITDALVDVMIR